MDKDKVQAGADLKAVMEGALSAKQMSVSALAREAVVQRADIYRWWRGDQRPSRNTLARVAPVLGIEVDVLREALGQAPSKVTPDLIDEIEARIRLAFREELRGRIGRASRARMRSLNGSRIAARNAASKRSSAATVAGSPGSGMASPPLRRSLATVSASVGVRPMAERARMNGRYCVRAVTTE